MVTEETPPDLDDAPELDEPPIGWDNETERAKLRPVDGEYQYGPGSGTPASGYNDGWSDVYRDLGGLVRPDSYYGAREFECTNCQAPKGEKCVVWVERIGRFVPRKMPCVARIRLAKDKGLL